MSKKIFYTKLAPKTAPFFQGGSSFILALLVGITFGFSFGCLMMNIYNWEQPRRPQPLPSQSEYSKVQSDLKHYLENNVEDNHFPNSRILRRPLNPINLHHHHSSK